MKSLQLGVISLVRSIQVLSKSNRFPIFEISDCHALSLVFEFERRCNGVATHQTKCSGPRNSVGLCGRCLQKGLAECQIHRKYRKSISLFWYTGTHIRFDTFLDSYLFQVFNENFSCIRFLALIFPLRSCFLMLVSLVFVMDIFSIQTIQVN